MKPNSSKKTQRGGAFTINTYLKIHEYRMKAARVAMRATDATFQQIQNAQRHRFLNCPRARMN